MPWVAPLAEGAMLDARHVTLTFGALHESPIGPRRHRAMSD